jgi:hypothetical protein
MNDDKDDDVQQQQQQQQPVTKKIRRSVLIDKSQNTPRRSVVVDIVGGRSSESTSNNGGGRIFSDLLVPLLLHDNVDIVMAVVALLLEWFDISIPEDATATRSKKVDVLRQYTKEFFASGVAGLIVDCCDRMITERRRAAMIAPTSVPRMAVAAVWVTMMKTVSTVPPPLFQTRLLQMQIESDGSDGSVGTGAKTTEI